MTGWSGAYGNGWNRISSPNPWFFGYRSWIGRCWWTRISRAKPLDAATGAGGDLGRAGVSGTTGVPGTPAELQAAIGEFQYAPWLVANLSLRGFPEERRGASLSWDNVLYDSAALGYVVATHQHLAAHQDRTVFTWYCAVRRPAGSRTATPAGNAVGNMGGWILRDLSRPHPDIRERVARLDLMRWGHAMIRPRPGFVWGKARQRLLNTRDRVLFAAPI